MKHNNQELETRKLGGKKPKGKSYHTKHRRMKMIASQHLSWLCQTKLIGKVRGRTDLFGRRKEEYEYS
jgi:hypothetical protein